MALAACLALAGCDGKAGVSIADAEVRLPVVAGRPGALYFTATGAGRPTRLVSVSSPKIEKIELHESMMHGGMMTMAPLAEVPLPASGKLAFAPGGKHGMLFGIDPALKPGDTVQVSFAFNSAPPVTVQAAVTAIGGE